MNRALIVCKSRSSEKQTLRGETAAKEGTVKPLEDQELFLKGVTRLLRITERADSCEKDTRRSAS